MEVTDSETCPHGAERGGCPVFDCAFHRGAEHTCKPSVKCWQCDCGSFVDGPEHDYMALARLAADAATLIPSPEEQERVLENVRFAGSSAEALHRLHKMGFRISRKERNR